MQIAQIKEEQISETMKAAELDMFINAAELIIKFYSS